MWTNRSGVEALRARSAGVTAVFPSGPTVAERLLRITIAFSRGPAAGEVPTVELRGKDGRPIEDPFVRQDLWSPDGRMLTLLLEPGRVKSGLIARKRLGGALVPGQRVTLVLAGVAVKAWQVVAGSCAKPEPAQWRIITPATGRRDALRVLLSGPMDIQARHLIAVADAAGNRLSGVAGFATGEAEWLFCPDRPWERGAHVLRVHPHAETPCGDAVGAPFEHATVDRTAVGAACGLPFHIG